MTTEKITARPNNLLPQETLATPEVKEGNQSSSVDLKGLRDSLDTKRQLLSLLEKGGYVKDVDIGEINRAIADLDDIIRLFPEEDLNPKGHI